MLLALVSYLALTPISHPVSTLCWDKINHLAAYLCLGLLSDMAISAGSRLVLKLFALLSYSVMIETIQHFIPGRHFSVFDITANALGLLAAGLLIYVIKKIKTIS